MATGRVLKNLLLMSALAGALLLAVPSQAGERYLGQRHEYRHHGGDRHGGNHWRGHDRRQDRHGGHGYRHGGHGGHGYRHGWGYRPYGHHYTPPRHYYPSHYHRHYRGCGHDGYHHSGLVEFLVDYSRHD